MDSLNTVCALCLNENCFLLHSSCDLLQGVEIGVLIRDCYGFLIENVRVCGDCVANLGTVHKTRSEALKCYEIFVSLRTEYKAENETFNRNESYMEMEVLEDVVDSNNDLVAEENDTNQDPNHEIINDQVYEEGENVQQSDEENTLNDISFNMEEEESMNNEFSDNANFDQCNSCGIILNEGSNCLNCKNEIEENDWPTTDDVTENSNGEWLIDESLFKNKEGQSYLYVTDMNESDLQMLDEHQSQQSTNLPKKEQKYDGECSLCGNGSNTSICQDCNEILERPEEESPDIFEDEDEDDKLPQIEHRKHCYICLTNVTNLKSHFKDKHFDTELICKICDDDVKFDNIWKLELHSQFHNPRRPLVCRYCPMRFYKDDKRKDHEKKNHTEKPPVNVMGFPCRYCGKVMKTRANMLVHEKQIHTSHRHFPCPYPECGKILSSTQALRGHKIIMHSKDFKHICETCGKGFITPINLKEHCRIHHSNVKEFQCEKCKREFKSIKYMKSHYRPNGECVKPRGSLMCEVCEEWFEGEAYDNHMGQFHPDIEFIFQCRRCPQKFKTRWEWEHHEAREKQRHERKKYLAMRKYQCDLCDKAFGAKNRLIKHRTTHTGQKIFKCPCCDFTCDKKDDMEKHKNTLHEKNGGPYICEFCQKEFKHGGNLKLHRRTHISDSSVFACFRCSREFPNQGSLDKHVKLNSCVIEVE